ncbi:hypothetical protein [Nonomuraea solani]|nr:hypothetical protein [Nonomuraea solani]
MPLSRLDLVTTIDVPGLVGASANTFTVGGAEVAIGPTGAVIVTDAVDDPAAGGVWSSTEFKLIGPMPGILAERFLGVKEDFDWLSWERPQRPWPIHLFVRLEGGSLYLGPVDRVQSERTDDPGPLVLGKCVLRIDPPLSFDVLDRVRPPSPVTALPGLEWLDHVNGDRATALRLFIESRYPLSHPAAPPATPSVPVWSLDPSEDDPTVWTIVDDEHRHAERERLSGFLLQFSLHEAMINAPYQAWSRTLPTPIVDELTGTLRRVPLKTWRYGSFYVAPGLIACVTGDEEEEECRVWFGATHRSLLRPLRGIEWFLFDG